VQNKAIENIESGVSRLSAARQPEAVVDAYKGEELRFGRDYLIPKPFDPRLITVV
jgi:malate dehydrogenase (oxaloacetate-decarboxylating)(NADP+)